MVRRRVTPLSQTHRRKKIRRPRHLPSPRTPRLSISRRNPRPRTRAPHAPPRSHHPRILPLPRRPLPRRSPPRQAQPPSLLLLTPAFPSCGTGTPACGLGALRLFSAHSALILLFPISIFNFPFSN